MGKQLRIRALELGRTQLGWVCDVTFTVETANQFTDEEHTAHSGGRWLLTALWNGFWRAKLKAAGLAARPGEREAKGWYADGHK